jgi:hypothetical protein
MWLIVLKERYLIIVNLLMSLTRGSNGGHLRVRQRKFRFRKVQGTEKTLRTEVKPDLLSYL